ncbi:MAG: hypothetical protein GX767_00600 [Firmicutes bacterium]|nr:hypothetical protein [Bacillota bacterium]
MSLQIPGKLKSVFLCLIIALALGTVWGLPPSFAQAAKGELPSIAVIIDGEEIEFDVSPQLIEGRTMVPLRGVFEYLGAVVSWEQETLTVKAFREEDGRTVTLTINSCLASIDGKEVTLDVPAMLYQNRTLIPLRFVTEAFGATVLWDGGARQVIVKTQPPAGEEKLTASEIFQRNKDAVVQIFTFDARGKELSSGTGFNISPRGTIVTSYHVLEKAAAVQVFFDDKNYPVKGYFALDKELDLVVLDIDGEVLPFVQLEDSTKIAGGEDAVVIGYPLRQKISFSEGRAVRLQLEGVNYIVTTAPVAPGSSGSPLFNAFGRVEGIIVASFTDGQNYNLAVPIDYLKQLNITGEPLPLEQLLEVLPLPEEGKEEEVTFTLPFYVFSDYLQKYHSQIMLDSRNQIQFFHVYAEEGKDTGNVLVIFLLDKDNYKKWLTALNGGQKKKIEQWALGVFQATEVIYPDRELTAGIMLQDCFVSYPHQFPASSIEIRDDCYYVKHYVGYFYHLEGQRHYRW